MASILKVDALQGITSAGDITVTSEGGAATQSLQQGLAKVRCKSNQQFNVYTVIDSFNTSSLTDESGVGQSTVAFTNNFANINFSYLGSGGDEGVGASNNDVEQTINNMLIFKLDGDIRFHDITRRLKDNGIHISNNKLGSILKSLSPEGKSITRKTNKGTRYYNLDWRDDYGTHGMPFNP